MSHRTNHGPWIFLVLLALGVLFGCAIPFGRQSAPLGQHTTASGQRTANPVAPQGQIVPQKTITLVGGPRLNHALHLENDLTCKDCHAPDEKTGEPGLPKLELCIDCHEPLEEGAEPEKGDIVVIGVFFDKDGKSLWKKAIAGYDSSVLFSHKAHVKLEDCTKCHQEMGADVKSRPGGAPYTMAECVACHKENSAPQECRTCHDRLDVTVQPPSHARDWRGAHGYTANHLRLTETQHDCSMCHSEPQFCSDCHKVTPPESHKHLWDKRHGQVVRAAGGDLPVSCSLCHSDRAFCERCHLDEAPRSHTTLFRTRTHGVMAAMDRRTCQTCHQVDFCQRCHEDTAPRSHRGLWARRTNNHCVQCHFPISSNDSCQVCHTTNPTHPSAPAQPVGHVPGRDCRVCHNAVGGGGAPPMRHLDNGMNCEFCHR